MDLPTPREQARETVTRTFFHALDQLIPNDPATPLPAKTLSSLMKQARLLSETLYHSVLAQHPVIDGLPAGPVDENTETDVARCGAD